VSVSLVYLRHQAYLRGQFKNLCFLNIFINYLCHVIDDYNCRLFTGDLKVYQAISSPADCLLLQSDAEFIRELCSANVMKSELTKLEAFLLP
jgi:hypothetical protein